MGKWVIGHYFESWRLPKCYSLVASFVCSSTKATKAKGRLSLGKKRSYSTKRDGDDGNDQAGNSKLKQRRLVKTEDKETNEDKNMQAQV